jgi:hypothetical protein
MQYWKGCLFATSELHVKLEAALTRITVQFHGSCILTFSKTELVLVGGYINPVSFRRANFKLQKHKNNTRDSIQSAVVFV